MCQITFLALLVLFVHFHSFTCSAPIPSASPTHSFKFIEFLFETSEEKDNYYKNEYFKNVVPAGIKLDGKGEIYASFPRWKPHVPYTLAKFNPHSQLFEPYPSFSLANGVANGSLHSVLGFEIDPAREWMYILDQGKLDGSGGMKLLIWDIAANQSVSEYSFKDGNEVFNDNSFLNDVVVDSKHNVLYISDSGKPVNEQTHKPRPALIRIKLNLNQNDLDHDPASIVIDPSQLQVDRFLDSHPSVLPDGNYTLNCDHCDSVTATGVDGIALSCDFKTIFWTPLTSSKLYAINTVFFDYPDYVDEMVAELGDKGSASDGFICSNSQNLFMTMLETNSLVMFDENLVAQSIIDILDKKEKVPHLTTVSGDDTIKWPDTLSIDTDGNLWVMSNNLGKFLAGAMDFSEENFHIYKYAIGEKSYILGCEDKGLRFGIPEIAVTSAGGGMYVIGIVIILVSTWCWRIIRKRRKHEKTVKYFGANE